MTHNKTADEQQRHSSPPFDFTFTCLSNDTTKTAASVVFNVRANRTSSISNSKQMVDSTIAVCRSTAHDQLSNDNRDDYDDESRARRVSTLLRLCNSRHWPTTNMMSDEHKQEARSMTKNTNSNSRRLSSERTGRSRPNIAFLVVRVAVEGRRVARMTRHSFDRSTFSINIDSQLTPFYSAQQCRLMQASKS